MLHNGHIHKYCWYMCINVHFQEGLWLQIFLWHISPCIDCTTLRYLSLNSDAGDLFPGLADGEGPLLRDITEQELCSGGGACLSSGKLSLSSEPSEEVLWKNTINVSMFCITYLDLHLFCTKCPSHSINTFTNFKHFPGTHEIKFNTSRISNTVMITNIVRFLFKIWIFYWYPKMLFTFFAQKVNSKCWISLYPLEYLISLFNI